MRSVFSEKTETCWMLVKGVIWKLGESLVNLCRRTERHMHEAREKGRV